MSILNKLVGSAMVDPTKPQVSLSIADDVDGQPEEAQAIRFDQLDDDLSVEFYVFSIVAGRRAVAVVTRNGKVRKDC